MRFAIWLPFSAAGDAKNGRLSATSLRHAPARFDHAPRTTHRFLPQTAISCALTSWVPRWLINRSTTPQEGGAENGSFSTTPAALWLLPSRHGYKYTRPSQPSILLPTLSSFRLSQHSKALPLIFRRAFFFSVVSCTKTSRALWQFLRTVGKII